MDRRRLHMGDHDLDDGLLGGDIVFAPLGTQASSQAGPSNRRQGEVLRLVDGRRTVVDILRLSPFSKDETLEHLRALGEVGQIGPRTGAARPNVVVIDVRPRGLTPGEGIASLGAARPNVVVIDTRHRDSSPGIAPLASAPGPAVVPRLAFDFQTPMNASNTVTPGNAGSSLYRLGSYEVATRIGQGGMGSVYVCRKAGATGAPRLYTLKVVRQYSAQQDLAVASLRREERLGPFLQHPNIHSVVDSGMYKEQPFIILDYVEGVSLADLLAGGRRPPVPIIIGIVLDVLRALERTHGARDDRGNLLGLVHCDVSPPNVLVGTNGVSRLTDFGSCRIVAEEGPNRPDPLKLGRPSYMAPEQLCAEPLDSRTDLFALGTVLYAALTGQDLFAADTYAQIVLNVLRKRIPPPSEHGAPACLDEICRRALSRPREGRFETASAMAQALVTTAGEAGLLASPSEIAEYMQNEFGELVDEQRRRIQRALEGEPAARVSSWDAPAGKAPGPDGGGTKGKTLFIPGPGQPEPGGDDLEDTERVRTDGRSPQRSEPRARRERRPRPDAPARDDARAGRDTAGGPTLSELWRWIGQERRVIALSIAVGTAVVVLTVFLNQGTQARPRPAAAAPASATPRPLPP